MRKARTFLVIADDPEQLMLITTTLYRKFPNAVVLTCRDSAAALEVTRTQRLDAIVAQRSSDMKELPLVEVLRAKTSAPILLMSGERHEEAAVAAGVSQVLSHDQWLLVGTSIARLIGANPAHSG